MSVKDNNIDSEGFESFAKNASTAAGDAGDAIVSDESFENNDNMSCPAANEADEYKDKFLRLSAEFDNYRKRTLKEKMDLVQVASEDVMKSLLAVLDDFDRALDAIEKSSDVDALREGVHLIHHKLKEILKNKGLEEIQAIGDELDTDFHDAIAKFNAGEEQKGKVIDVAQKGYKLKDKVIRHCKVVVGE